MPLCKFCNREIKNRGALAIHEPHCKLNPNRTKNKILKMRIGQRGWLLGIKD